MTTAVSRLIVPLLVFWGMQVGAQLFFKWGTLHEGKWLTGFLLGNVLGFSSIYLLMLVYKEINPNLALALGAGGSFLCCQIAIALVFHQTLGLPQWAGIVAIVAGMALFAVRA